jgi:hypothetical protein
MSYSFSFLMRWLSVVALWSGALPLQGANLLMNSGFAGGTTPWASEGAVFNTGEAAVFSDQGGEWAVLFQTAAMPVATTIALQLSFDFLNALSPLVPAGATPDALFASTFAGEMPFGGDFLGGMFEVASGVLDADFRGSPTLYGDMEVSASAKGGGWVHYRLSLPVAAFVTVAFEFIDGNGVAGDSVAAVDNVVLEAVTIPEPAPLGALGAVLVAVGLRRQRRAGGVGVVRCKLFPVFSLL